MFNKILAITASLGVAQMTQAGSTDQLESKIIGDLTQMIHEYDFTSVFDQAVGEEQARQIKWQQEYKPSVQELLVKL